MAVGISTGQPIYDKKKAQERKIKFEQEVWYGNFEGNKMKPTPEQIEQKKKREVIAAEKELKRVEKRRRGSNTIRQRKARERVNKNEDK